MKLKTLAPVVLAAALGGCSLGGLLGGGGEKSPATLLTLSSEAPDPGQIVRAANAGEAVTIADPVVAKELRTVRVAVQATPTDVQYVSNLQMADTPDQLFRELVEETVRRTTNRVVLDPHQASLDPGLLVTGALQRFDYDAATGQVIVQYDGSLLTAGATRVETRRFTATAPADGSAGTVGPALDSAANRVAAEIAKRIGG